MWDEIYNTAAYVYGTEPNQFLQEAVLHIPKGNILCLGDGEGRNSIYLAKLGYNVTAIDLSLVAINKARKLADEHQVQINHIHENLEHFKFGAHQWDGIVSIFCHLPSILRSQVHQSVCQSLRPKGVFVIEGYTVQQLQYKTGGPSSADMMISSQILSTELSQLEPLILTETERFIHEGQKHHGLSHVVQGIFTKSE
ncbi:tellurite resistance protein TehB [Vibrio aerogenes CECT 7868]|uniref:Tellurite resistance protein TehB n=1 Tax=Vibrio aerogenes CECT 7868 TaxID=1216006 RepID=A0A1M5XTK3_9VIBR|nr:class I SAM-dependent methyltransferase [Vibrio aerogenes]SHI03155.1 tellurite resistance protein TehB [Vibrio aerogenes CECT 7868]